MLEQTNRCLKCNSEKIVPNVRILDRSHHYTERDLTAVFYEDPDALIFSGPHEGSLYAQVCGECGYTEMYLEDPQDFYAAYSETVRDLE